MTDCRLLTARHPDAGFRIQIRAIRADVTERLHQRLLPFLYVDHLARGVEPEAHRRLLMAGVIECQLVVEDHLRSRIELLNLHADSDGLPGGGLKVRDIDGIFAGDDAAHGDDFLPDGRGDLLAVDDDEIVGTAAIVAVEGEETGFAPAVPGDVAGRVLYEQIEIIGVI